jgi:hypothetical protein
MDFLSKEIQAHRKKPESRKEGRIKKERNIERKNKETWKLKLSKQVNNGS